ncbi:unnamed protein product [Gongylonema pulchrum]|uniref:Uncharacterized protein n=1 Tax=Gongylonema pulchrum TaxID=637853 RepID=A0A183DSM9_9BILA|nr:unnamed protein product [Gongylonema pulchrum]
MPVAAPPIPVPANFGFIPAMPDTEDAAAGESPFTVDSTPRMQENEVEAKENTEDAAAGESPFTVDSTPKMQENEVEAKESQSVAT